MNMNLLHVVIQHILKGYVKVTILLTLNRSKRIIKCVVLGVLFTCVLFGLSSAPIFAASEESPSSEVSSWLAPDLDSVQAKTLAEQMSDRAVAADYTTTDIYNLLYNAMRGEVYNSTYSLPRIASYTDRIAQILYGSGQSVPTQSLYANLREIHFILNGSSSGTFVRPDIQSSLYRTDPSSLDTITLSQDAGSILEMTQLSYAVLNQLHGDLQNHSSYLSTINSNLSTSWNNISNSYSYTRTSPSGSNLSSDSWQTNFYCYFTGLNSVDISNPQVFRFLAPVRTYGFISDLSQVLSNFEVYILRNGELNLIPIDLADVYFETTYHGTYVYLFGFDISDYLNDVVLHFTTNQTIKFYTSNSAVVSYLPFNTYYAQVLKTAFYQESTSKSFGEISSNVDRLAKYLADPDKIAAEDASQQVIDDTLDGFTGNGSAAAKTSDTGSMKNMSGSIQNGLDSGASVSNATSVFNLNGGFWNWFTQENSDMINNPYPAPVVNSNTRKSSNGDQVIDFLSGNDSEVDQLLRGAEW